MKIILFAGLLAVLVSPSEAVRCEDIQTCVTNMNIQENNLAKLCGSLRALLSCMRSALSDCRDTGSVPESALNTMDQQMQTYSIMMNDRCDDYTRYQDKEGKEESWGSGSWKMKMSFSAVVASFLAVILL